MTLWCAASRHALMPDCVTNVSPVYPDSNLLDSEADGIEVSYNACGVLSHIMFDGPEAWVICEPRREEVVDRMWAAIQRWDVNSRRNINYR